MVNEIKISLPLYKIAYSLCFILGLSLVRGTAYTCEIGIALEAPMAILATVFLADTYVQEIAGKRWEVYGLFPLRKKVLSIIKRIGIQESYLLILSIVGYACFGIFQKPMGSDVARGVGSDPYLFWVYVMAVVVTINFWGILSNMIASLSGSMWAGVGGSLLLWICTNSRMGDRILGDFNVFSYTFRCLEGSGNCANFSWLWGKAVCICLSVLMLLALPKVLIVKSYCKGAASMLKYGGKSE